MPRHRSPVGNVVRVVTELVDPEPEQPKYNATRMVYGRNQTAVSYVMGETWEGDGETTWDYNITYGREFRYDGARQRYLNRELNLVDLASGTIKEQLNGDTRWSEYDGDDIYADFTIDVNDDVIVETWYEPGVARSSMPSDPAGTEYYHTNHLGTTRLMSDDQGLPFGESVYSAFGESVAGAFHRYGYVGAHGYQTHTDFPFMHLGARYYDPATGRFLQRDPIGLLGGMNVYSYVDGQVTVHVDPLGLFSIEKGIAGGIGGGIMGARGGPLWAFVGVCVGFVTAGWERGDVHRFMRWWKANAGGIGGPSHHKISCFVAGTTVHTSNGEANIESVVVGADMLTYDAKTGENGTGQTTDVLVGIATELVHIAIADEILTCTPEHPFWVVGHGWVIAGRLCRGDALLSVNGDEVPILGVEREVLCIPVKVYNITVDEHHTYFIGDSKILVHNKML